MDREVVELLKGIKIELKGIKEAVSDVAAAMIMWLQASVEQREEPEEEKKEEPVTVMDFYQNRGQKK